MLIAWFCQKMLDYLIILHIIFFVNSYVAFEDHFATDSDWLTVVQCCIMGSVRMLMCAVKWYRIVNTCTSTVRLILPLCFKSSLTLQPGYFPFKKLNHYICHLVLWPGFENLFIYQKHSPTEVLSDPKNAPRFGGFRQNTCHHWEPANDYHRSGSIAEWLPPHSLISRPRTNHIISPTPW